MNKPHRGNNNTKQYQQTKKPFMICKNTWIIYIERELKFILGAQACTIC